MRISRPGWEGRWKRRVMDPNSGEWKVIRYEIYDFEEMCWGCARVS